MITTPARIIIVKDPLCFGEVLSSVDKSVGWVDTVDVVLGLGEMDGDGVAVGAGDGVGVAVGVGVVDAVGVELGVAVGCGVAVGIGVGVGIGVVEYVEITPHSFGTSALLFGAHDANSPVVAS